MNGKEMQEKFLVEQQQLVTLQNKTIARLHFIEGALYVLNNAEIVKEEPNG